MLVNNKIVIDKNLKFLFYIVFSVEVLFIFISLINIHLVWLFFIGVSAITGLFILFEKSTFYAIPFFLFAILPGSISSLFFLKNIPNIYYVDLLFIFVALILTLKFFINFKLLSMNLSKYEFLLIVFIFICFLSGIQSVDTLRSMAYLRNYVIHFFILSLSLKYIKGPKQINMLFGLLMIWGVVLSFIEIIYVLKQGDIIITIITKNVHLPCGSSNYLAAFYVVLIPMGISVLLTRSLSIIKRIFLIFIIVILMTALLITASRGGVVALVFGILLLIFRSRSWKTLFAFIFFISIIGYLAYLNPATSFIIEGITGFRESASVFSRVGLWVEGWRIFSDHPVFGVGLGNMHYFVHNYFIKLTGNFELLKAHNLILELLVEVGVIGFIAFFSVLFLVYRKTFLNLKTNYDSWNKSLAWGFFAGLGAAFVHSMVEPNITSYFFGVFFWIIAAMVIKQYEFYQR